MSQYHRNFLWMPLILTNSDLIVFVLQFFFLDIWDYEDFSGKNIFRENPNNIVLSSFSTCSLNGEFGVTLGDDFQKISGISHVIKIVIIVSSLPFHRQPRLKHPKSRMPGI